MLKLDKSKLKTTLIALLSSIWVLGLGATLVLSLLLPNFLNKYKIDLIESVDRSETRELAFFEDYNNDGFKENISILNYRNRFASCLLKKNDGTVIEQFNLYGKMPKQENLNTPIFNDVNKDGIEELFVFTQKSDSLFISAIDLSLLKVIVNAKFVAKIGMKEGFDDFVLRPIINHDYNSDGVNEMYFLLNGGFSLFPRKIMAYDYVNDTIISSINTGSQHFVKPLIMGDTLIFISTTRRTNNCSNDFPYKYPDTVSRLFSFNDKLELMYEPLSFVGASCSVNGPIVYKNELHYAVLNCEAEGTENYMIAMSLEGNILRKKEFKHTLQKSRAEKIMLDDEYHYLFNSVENGVFTFYEYDPQLMQLERNSVTEKLPKGELIPISIDKIGSANIFIDYKTKKTCLFLDDLQHQVSFNKELYIKEWNLYMQTKIMNEGQIIMVADAKMLHSYLLSNNVYYPLRYVVYLLLYLLCVGIIYLPRRRRLLHVAKREKLRKEISTLQLKLVNAQLDPHFTFNALNTVSAKILKGERFEAYDLMTSFSSLMRLVMLNSDKDKWSLKEELNFSKNYLMLMQGRFSNVFKFSFEVDTTIDTDIIFIPRLLLQNFIENIIKHAFKGINYEGFITVEIFRNTTNFQIKISDNGIGREQALINAENDVNRSGKGTSLNRKQIEIYNKLYATHINFSITDLYNNNTSSGTQVIINIPEIEPPK